MDDIDAEVAALAAFSARMTRGRLMVGLPCIAVGLGVGVAAFFLWAPEGPAGLAVGVLLFGMPFAASLVGGVLLARRYTAATRDTWLNELAEEYGVPPERLRERAQMFE